MKCTIATLVLFFAFNVQSFAQYRGRAVAYYGISAGINSIDNSRNSHLPFDGAPLYVNTSFFIAAERKFLNNLSLSLNLSTNQIDIGATLEPYFSADIFANIFLNDLLLRSDKIELYVGLGTGVHTLRGNGAAVPISLNGGIRYWFTEKFGINLQGIAKYTGVEKGIPQLDNHYQFNLGVSYRVF